MRLRQVLPALCAIALPCLGLSALPSPTQTATNTGATAATIATTFSSGVGSGHLCVCVIVSQKATTPSRTVTGVSDDKGDTFTVLDQQTYNSTAFYGACFAYCLNTTSGATVITATFSAAPTTSSMISAEYGSSGATLDQHIATNGVSASAASGSTSATTGAPDLIVGWVQGNNTVTISAPNPSGDYTQAGTAMIAAFSDAKATVTGTQAASYTLSSSNPWACGVVAFSGLTWTTTNSPSRLIPTTGGGLAAKPRGFGALAPPRKGSWGGMAG